MLCYFSRLGSSQLCKLLEQFLESWKPHSLSQAQDGVRSSSSEWPSFTQNHRRPNIHSLSRVPLWRLKLVFALSASRKLSSRLLLILGNNGLPAGLAEQHANRAQSRMLLGSSILEAVWAEPWFRRGLELRNLWSVHFLQAKACEWVTVGPGTGRLTLGRKAEG